LPIPDAFRILCRSFHQGVGEIYSSADEIIKSAVDELTVEQKHVVKTYIDELTSGKYDEEQLWNIWEEAGARIRITDGTPGTSARFLGMIRAVLDT
jgi:hypothetical protein